MNHKVRGLFSFGADQDEEQHTIFGLDFEERLNNLLLCLAIKSSAAEVQSTHCSKSQNVDFLSIGSYDYLLAGKMLFYKSLSYRVSP